jgi:galactose mutarotase-like enzyme
MNNQENYLTFKKNDWELILNLQGGRVAYLNYKNKNILGSFARMDGKEGNTHLCLPNFGVEGEDKYGLPFHGFARTSYWKKEEESHQYLSISTWIKATHKYESDLQVIQKFILEKEYFQQEISVTNQGSKSVPVNVGIHNYWNTIQGWDGLAINGYKVTDLVKENGYINIGAKNEIVFPIGKKVLWELTGFNRAVLWTAQKDGHYNADFVCIEPVKEYALDYFGSPSSLLAPKKTFVCSQKIVI